MGLWRPSDDQADVAAIYKRLSFAGVQILTLSEGWIEELHVGLKGTMNQLFLKDLAAKTRRGLRLNGMPRPCPKLPAQPARPQATFL
jgi:hypothetical protein